MNGQSKHNEWEEAFADAQMTPDVGVWNNIELELAKTANGTFKKRILFLKLLAAASIALAMVVGGGVVYNQYFTPLESTEALSVPVENNVDDNVRTHEEVYLSEANAERQTASNSRKEKATNDGNSLKESNENKQLLAEDDATDSKGKTSENISENSVIYHANDPGNMITQNDVESAFEIKENDLSKVVAVAKKSSHSDPNILDNIGVSSDYNLALLERELRMVPRLDRTYAKANRSDDFWLGVNFAFGSNSPSSGASSTQAETMSFSDASGNLQEANAMVSEERHGAVMIAGLGVGKQLSKRWMLESGLAYSKRSTFVESNLAVTNNGRVEALNNFNEASADGALIFTDSYEMKNSYNSIAIPLQAGYKVVDGLLDLYLKAGVVNEFLLWNKVEDTDGNYGDVTIGSGSDSPYNSYILNGTAGSELRYQVGGNYHISLLPQVQKSLNSVLKSDENGDVKPFLFTIGLRFKYQFD